ncbi:MAG: hypothetical protein KBC84_10830 [Proteobacteria bacterium]|nr:hypothetical protein [Pseudomonadota bacterium]
MNFKLNASFVLISSSLLLWCASAYITQTTMAYRETSKPAEEVNQIAAMSEQVKSNPNDLDLHLKLAKTLQSDGYKSSNVNTLMQALEEYKKVLEIQSDNPEALLGIADICMDSGIPDKAAEYYEKYINTKKDDITIMADYSLALLQIGKTELAEKNIKEALLKEENLKNNLTLALIYKLKEQKEDALSSAKKALSFAKSEMEIGKVNEFISSLNKANEVVNTANISPAMMIDDYFRNHQIIGPKLDKIQWLTADTVNILVKDFPISQMPPFAKQKFTTSIKDKMKVLPQKIIINIIGSEKETLKIEVGAQAN